MYLKFLFIYRNLYALFDICFIALISQFGSNDITREILNAASLPCNLEHLQQDLKTLLRQV